MNNNIFKSSKNNNYNSNYKKNDNLDFKRNNYFLNKNKNKLESSFVLKEEMFPELHKKEEIQINNNSLNPNEKKNNFSTLFKNLSGWLQSELNAAEINKVNAIMEKNKLKSRI